MKTCGAMEVFACSLIALHVMSRCAACQSRYCAACCMHHACNMQHTANTCISGVVHASNISQQSKQNSAQSGGADFSMHADGAASEEGLAAYAMDTVPEDLLQQATATDSTSAAVPPQRQLVLANADPAVIEMLQGQEKLISGRHLPRLQEWLKIVVKVGWILQA